MQRPGVGVGWDYVITLYSSLPRANGFCTFRRVDEQFQTHVFSSPWEHYGVVGVDSRHDFFRQ